MGLSITRDLAFAMRGDIRVKSELGKGSCFTLTISVKRVPDEDIEEKQSNQSQEHIQSQLLDNVSFSILHKCERSVSVLERTIASMGGLSTSSHDYAAFMISLRQSAQSQTSSRQHICVVDMDTLGKDMQTLCQKLHGIENVFDGSHIVSLTSRTTASALMTQRIKKKIMGDETNTSPKPLKYIFLNKPFTRNDIVQLVSPQRDNEMTAKSVTAQCGDDETVTVVPGATSSTSSRKLEVLLVDDNAINLKLIKKMLGLDGHRVWTAEGGPQSIEIFKKHWDSIDCCLMDINVRYILHYLDRQIALYHALPYIISCIDTNSPRLCVCVCVK